MDSEWLRMQNVPIAAINSLLIAAINKHKPGTRRSKRTEFAD